MKGFLGGAATGLVLSALSLGTISVLSEAPAGNTPPEAPLQDAPEVAAPPEASVEPANGPGQGEGPSLAAPPEVAAPQVTNLGSGDTLALDTAEPAAPDAVALEGGLEVPGSADAPGVALEADSPVLPNPLAAPPATPDSEADIVLSTDPAPLPQAVLVEEDAVAPDPEPPATQTPGDAAEEEGLLVVDLGEGEDAPAIVLDTEVGETPTQPEAAPTPEPAEQPGVADEAPADLPLEDPTPPEDAGSEAETEPAPRIALQGNETTMPGGGTAGVTIRRPGVEAEPDPAAFDLGQPLGALELYAAATPEPGPLPRMSVILIDDGGLPEPAAVLAGVPFPVTIAIDPALDGAVALMAEYRNAGREVVLLARIPENAAPQDVDITYESLFSDYKETIAVLDIGDGGYQGSAEVTEQAMLYLAEDGRGFVTASTGLNTALREASRAGVPAATIYRDLDADGQDARVIRRFIDQAAFRARQESGVVLVGRMRPDTLSALILWGSTDRAEQVAVVPLSRVLLGQ